MDSLEQQLPPITEAEAELARATFNELVAQYPETFAGILPSDRYALFDYPQQADKFCELFPDWTVEVVRREIYHLIGEEVNGRTLVTLIGGGTQSPPRPERSYRVSSASVARLKALSFLFQEQSHE